MKTKRLFSALLAVVLMLSACGVQVYASNLSSSDKATIAEYEKEQQKLKDKIASTQGQLDDLKGDIKQQEAYVNELNNQIANYQSQIDLLNDKINALETEKAGIQEKVDEIQAEIDGIKKDINHNVLETINTNHEIDDTLGELKDRLCEVYIDGSVSDLQFLLDSGDNCDFSTYLMMLEISSRRSKEDSEMITNLNDDISKIDELTEKYNTMIADLKVSEDALQVQIDALNEKEEAIEADKKELLDAQGDIQALEREASAYLDELDKQSQAYKDLIDRYESDINAFESKIDSIIAAASRPSTNVNVNANPGGFIWPLQYSDAYISSNYGYRGDPISGVYKLHGGVDTCCRSGTMGKAVVAAAAGTVIISTWHSSYGYYVGVDHGNGYVTIYAHNSSLAVSVGQSVSQGQVVAYAGSTGYSTGAHCHFEIRVNGTKVDPLGYCSP